MIRQVSPPGSLLVASATQPGQIEVKPRRLRASDYGAILPTKKELLSLSDGIINSTTRSSSPTPNSNEISHLPNLRTPPRKTRVYREHRVQRNIILIDTITKLEEASSTGHYHKCALRNLEAWKAKARCSTAHNEKNEVVVHLLPGDWGDVTLTMTKRYGRIFACLNMANAHSPGGGYTHGYAAQEENMYRRTDCHFFLDRKDLDDELMYLPEKTRLLNAVDDRVYLDATCPRVCIRGAEDRTASDLGYALLPQCDLFLFYELRSAAVDLRFGRARYDRAETSKRIAAQLDTLIEHGVRHVVLSAFGCGAFENPSDDVAAVYKEELQKRRSDFDVVAFGIFNAGYGPCNFGPFQKVFGDWAKP